MKFIFKCKIVDGVIKRPDWHHKYVIPQRSDLQFRMDARRLFKAHPELNLPEVIRADDLPPWITIEEGFISTITIDFDAALMGEK